MITLKFIEQSAEMRQRYGMRRPAALDHQAVAFAGPEAKRDQKKRTLPAAELGKAPPAGAKRVVAERDVNGRLRFVFK